MSNTYHGQLLSQQQLVSGLPADFLWGSATSAYQIEGAVKEDGRGVSIWDTFSATPGKTFQGETGEVADNYYHRFADDVALMSALHLNAYRFSIAWPRILPEGQGQVNERGLDFYERVLDTVLAQGIKPFVTLYHWDLPQTLQDRGGWVNRATASAFADYAEIVARRLGDRVAGWITHNEPWCAAYLGYGNGLHAPGIQDRQAAMQAGHHILLSHGLAVPRLRAASAAGTQVGITLNFTPAYPADQRPETLRDAAHADAFNNRWFLDPLFHGAYPEEFFSALHLAEPEMQDDDFAIITTPIDFLGVNNYTRMVVCGQEIAPPSDAVESVASLPGAHYTEMNWEVAPQACYELLKRLHTEYHVPALYVTENGAAFADEWSGGDEVIDPQRVSYLEEYIQGVVRARSEGVPIKGYFAWSLLDNFEWAEGYSKRFGLIYVDYATQRRIIKESGRWFSSLIETFSATHMH